MSEDRTGSSIPSGMSLQSETRYVATMWTIFVQVASDTALRGIA
jgi:hypothetical protein